MSTTGLIKKFTHYIKPWTGWFYKSTGNTPADAVNLYDVLVGSPQTPLSFSIGSVYASDIDVSGSSVGTFTGEITGLVDSLDSTLYDDTATNPKYFEIKLARPIENASIKFCAPEDGDFSNVKIVLKDRSGTTLYTCDNSANSTKLNSAEYDWPLTAWCSVRVEFHTADAVKINWALIEKATPILTHIKHVDRVNITTTPLGAGATWTGDWVPTQHYAQAILDIVSDQSGTLTIELSNDASTVEHSHSFNILPNTPDGHHYPSGLELSYYRPKYVNGDTEQGTFRLLPTLFATAIEEGHTHGLDYPLQDDHPAAIVRAVQTGKKPNGDYVNAEYTTGGNPKASIEELDDSVANLLSLRPAGASINASITLTSADTLYAIPAISTNNAFRINIYNGSDTSVFLCYASSGLNGIELPPGDTAEDDLATGQSIYAYCASPGKVLKYTYKEVV